MLPRWEEKWRNVLEKSSARFDKTEHMWMIPIDVSHTCVKLAGSADQVAAQFVNRLPVPRAIDASGPVRSWAPRSPFLLQPAFYVSSTKYWVLSVYLANMRKVSNVSNVSPVSTVPNVVNVSNVVNENDSSPKWHAYRTILFCSASRQEWVSLFYSQFYSKASPGAGSFTAVKVM